MAGIADDAGGSPPDAALVAAPALGPTRAPPEMAPAPRPPLVFSEPGPEGPDRPLDPGLADVPICTPSCHYAASAPGQPLPQYGAAPQAAQPLHMGPSCGHPDAKDFRDDGKVAGADELQLPVKLALDLKQERLTGVIATYTPSNAWGYITSRMFEGEIVFRADGIMPEFQGHPLNSGEAVEFDVQADDNGQPLAVALKPVLGRKPSDCVGQRNRGYVRRFAERWGFLNAAAFDGDLFVHRDNLLHMPEHHLEGQPPLRAGQAVEFDVALDDRGRAVAKQITTRALLRPCDWIGHRMRGYVRNFQGAWGFINSERFAGDLFVHRDSLLAHCYGMQLAAGLVVEFDVERDHHRKGAKNRLVARNVAVIPSGNGMMQGHGWSDSMAHQQPSYSSHPSQGHYHSQAGSYGHGQHQAAMCYGQHDGGQANSYQTGHHQQMYYGQQDGGPSASYGGGHQQPMYYSQDMSGMGYGSYSQQQYSPNQSLGSQHGMQPPYQQQQQQQYAPQSYQQAPYPQQHGGGDFQRGMHHHHQQQHLPPGVTPAGDVPHQASSMGGHCSDPSAAAGPPLGADIGPGAFMPSSPNPCSGGGPGPGPGPGTGPPSDGQSQGLLHITMHDWEPDQPGQLYVTKGTLVNVSYQAPHGWVYASMVQPGNESSEPLSEGWIPQAVVKRVSLCRVCIDWPSEGGSTLGVGRGEIVAVSKEADRGWVYGERIGPRSQDRPSDGWLPKKVLESLQP